jgi:glyoxylase-like metal-dependent hydrolase (beta-lactamase superfamily II)
MKSNFYSNDITIYKFKLGTGNSFLIKTSNNNLLIDTGSKWFRKKLVRNIKKVLGCSKIDFLILTHTHFDHCQNAAFIRREFGGKIVVGKNEEMFTKLGYSPIPKGSNVFTKVLSKIGGRIGRKWFGYEPFECDVYVDDDLQLAKNIVVSPTPGHSKGSISVIIDGNVGVVGDNLFGVFPNNVFPPFVDDPVEMIRTWEKLVKTGCELFLPGHGGSISISLLIKQLKKYSRKYNS